MLNQLERTIPSLVHNVVPKPVPLSLLTDILRRLVREKVSIHPLREILEALTLDASSESDPELLTERVRVRLNRQITQKYANSGVLDVHEVDPDTEGTLHDATRQGPTGSYLALPPDQACDIIQVISKACP